MDGDAGPGAELRVGEMKRVPDDGEEVERAGVQEEDGGGGDGHVAGGGTDGGADGGDGGPAADRGARAEEDREFLAGFEELPEEEPEGEGAEDGGRGEEEALGGGGEELAEVHAQAQRDDAGLDEEAGEFLSVGLEGGEVEEREDDAEREGERGREPGRGAGEDAEEEDDASEAMVRRGGCG